MPKANVKNIKKIRWKIEESDTNLKFILSDG